VFRCTADPGDRRYQGEKTDSSSQWFNPQKEGERRYGSKRFTAAKVGDFRQWEPGSFLVAEGGVQD